MLKKSLSFNFFFFFFTTYIVHQIDFLIAKAFRADLTHSGGLMRGRTWCVHYSKLEPTLGLSLTSRRFVRTGDRDAIRSRPDNTVQFTIPSWHKQRSCSQWTVHYAERDQRIGLLSPWVRLPRIPPATRSTNPWQVPWRASRSSLVAVRRPGFGSVRASLLSFQSCG